MSDTMIWLNKRLGGGWFSITLYVVNSICLVVGAAMLAMNPAEWEKMSGMQRVGWGLLLVGNVTNTWKAATSSSTRKDLPQ